MRGRMISAVLLLMAGAVQAQELVNFELASKARPYSLKNPVDRESRDFSMSKPGILTIFYESAPYHSGPGGHSFEKIDAKGGVLDDAPTMGTGGLLEILPKEGGFVDRRTIRHEILIHGPLPEGQKYRAWLTAWHAYQAFQIRGDGQQHAAVQKLNVTYVSWDRLYDAPGPPPEIDISGKWHHGDTVTSSWHFTPAGNGEYEFEEKGADNVKGKARVKGRTIFIEYTRAKDGKRNVHIITVDPKEGRHAPGWAAGEIFTGGDSTTVKFDTPVKPVDSGGKPDVPVKPIDITGTWQHGTAGETWTFTPLGSGQFTATEKGFGNAKGIATVSGDKIHIDYTTTGGLKGTYDVTIAADGKSGKGVWTEVGGSTGSRDFVRVGAGPDSSSSGSDSTTAGTQKPPGTDADSAGTVGEPAAVTKMTLQAGKRRVLQGESVSIPIWLLKGQGVADLNFNIKYDASVAKATGAFAKGNLLDKALFETNPEESGIVRVGFAQNADLSGDGTVAQVTFQASGAPGTSTPLTLEVTTISGTGGGKPTIELIHGEILVVGKDGNIPGDADGDGKITARDAGEALKMSVKLIPVKMVCDLDNDGQVTSTDARLILAKASGK